MVLLTYVFFSFFFFFNDTAPPEIYPLPLHDALPIWPDHANRGLPDGGTAQLRPDRGAAETAALEDRKSTRLNSSHANISYAVFCLKKKKTAIAGTYDYQRDEEG